VLRGIFRPKRDQKSGENYMRRSLIIYPSPSVVWVIKLRMRWVGHVAHMGERHIQGFGWEI